MLKKIVIAIDGTAGAGKGTLAKGLAQKLDLPYMDTGKLYRAVAAISLNKKADEVQIARHLAMSDTERPDLRTPQVTKKASIVAKNPQVRQALVDLQRDFANQHGGVLDGRDIGTVIFPNAPVKFFLTASAAVRAKRRFLQEGGDLNQDDAHARIKEIEEAIKQRDAQDEGRAHAPLCVAKDAYTIDTDDKTIDDILKIALKVVFEKTSQIS